MMNNKNNRLESLRKNADLLIVLRGFAEVSHIHELLNLDSF
jgi:hypothetical protein